MTSDIELRRRAMRHKLQPKQEDGEYNKWLLSTSKVCFYCGQIKPLCLDHILGGYFGIKANGLLKVPACQECNSRAEIEPALHESAYIPALESYVIYHSEKLE